MGKPKVLGKESEDNKIAVTVKFSFIKEKPDVLHWGKRRISPQVLYLEADTFMA